ncbi:MAG: glycosyltransferase [Oscillospiraceae bacterium]|nr:glycosyltransferase [Oscillospiraceae bacterium]
MSGKISILMGIYNCADTLEQAVLSIQNQTYSNWELILCEDGSSDNTYEVAQTLASKDSRIVLLRNEKNLGLNATLNRCFRVASGEFIARMDGDDDCMPDRFEKQLHFLESHPEFQIVSSAMTLFDESGEWGRAVCPEYPQPEDTVGGTAFCHAAVLMKKECMDAVGGYTEDPRMLRVEDVNLWIKLYAAGYRGYNIQEPLYRMRNDQNALNRRKYIYRVNSVYVRMQGCRMLKLGPKSYLKACSPMINGLVPARLRQWMRKQQRKV